MHCSSGGARQVHGGYSRDHLRQPGRRGHFDSGPALLQGLHRARRPGQGRCACCGGPLPSGAPPVAHHPQAEVCRRVSCRHAPALPWSCRSAQCMQQRYWPGLTELRSLTTSRAHHTLSDRRRYCLQDADPRQGHAAAGDCPCAGVCAGCLLPGSCHPAPGPATSAGAQHGLLSSVMHKLAWPHVLPATTCLLQS